MSEVMNMRHAGVLSALLLTAALLCAMPGLMRLPVQQDRTDERLRPAQLRTLTVWLMPGDVGDRKLINQLCTAFEKQRKGVRIFLRVVPADEWTGETAVLPDVALFETGDIAAPEQLFLPLEHAIGNSGMFAGVQRAVPLWLAPNVLSIPQSWLQSTLSATPRPDSLLSSATAEPAQQHNAVLYAAALPWPMLLRQGATEMPEGVGWQQLLSVCPAQLRSQLLSSLLDSDADPPVPSPGPDEWVTTLPVPRGASPTPLPRVDTPARVETLAQHQSRLQQGEALAACVLTPAVSQRVRYTALCRNGEDAKAFVLFLLQQKEAALQHGLVAPGCESSTPDPLLQSLMDAYQQPVLPNAFAHTKQELAALCADGFARCEDPVRTLLGLR